MLTSFWLTKGRVPGRSQNSVEAEVSEAYEYEAFEYSKDTNKTKTLRRIGHRLQCFHRGPSNV
jgi:hypothetical protein